MDNESIIKKKINEITLKDINTLEKKDKILVDISYLGRPYNFGTRKLFHKNKPFENNYTINSKYYKSNDQFRQKLEALGKKMISEITKNLANKFKNLLFFILIYQDKMEEPAIEQSISYENNIQKIATYHLELF